MCQIISNNQGWITVAPENQNRKHPMEKDKLEDFSKTNKLSPEWMQTNHEKPGTDPLKAVGCYNNARKERARLIIAEKVQPPRSVFNIGTFRHNVANEEQAAQSMAEAVKNGMVMHPVRMIEWNETNPKKQSYDKHVSPKIGSNHFV